MDTDPANKVKWHDIAGMLEDALRGELPGRRDLKIMEFADEHRLSPVTLRFYAAAHRFLKRLSKTDLTLSRELETMPVDAITVINRWSRYNPESAREVARSFVDGKIKTVRELQRREKSARSDKSAGTTPKLALRSQIEEKRSLYIGRVRDREGEYIIPTQFQFEEYWIESGEDLEKFRGEKFPIGGAFAKPSPEERRFLRVDLVAGSTGSRLLLLMVGPYSRAENETSRAPEWILRSVGVSRLTGEPVGLILPPGAREEAFVKGLQWVEKTEIARAKALRENAKRKTAQDSSGEGETTRNGKRTPKFRETPLSIYLIRLRADGFETLYRPPTAPVKAPPIRAPEEDAEKILAGY